MNTQPWRSTVSARIQAIAVAAFAAFAIASMSAADTDAASSGGIGAEGEDSGSSDDKYALLWEKTSSRDRRWARSTAECESGGDPNAIGGGGQYRGAFQFLKSTWKSSPKSPGGDPIDHPYRTQAVVAIALKDRDGAGHWPVCG